jgi:hypothetical protein
MFGQLLAGANVLQLTAIRLTIDGGNRNAVTWEGQAEQDDDKSGFKSDLLQIL